LVCPYGMCLFTDALALPFYVRAETNSPVVGYGGDQSEVLIAQPPIA